MRLEGYEGWLEDVADADSDDGDNHGDHGGVGGAVEEEDEAGAAVGVSWAMGKVLVSKCLQSPKPESTPDDLAVAPESGYILAGQDGYKRLADYHRTCQCGRYYRRPFAGVLIIERQVVEVGLIDSP